MNHHPPWDLMALLEKSEKDDYYRNDSLEYCRHEEKKKENQQMEGAKSDIYTNFQAAGRSGPS